MKSKGQSSLVEKVKTLKQPKLAFTSEAKKRKNKDEDVDERAAKKQRTNNQNIDVPKQGEEPLTQDENKDLYKTKKNVVEIIQNKESTLEEDSICDKETKGSIKFSNSMKDAVKTECRICRQAVSLTTMRGHTKSAHKMSISDYKETHGNHRTQIIEKIFHKCGLCQQAILLDSDDIAHHLKKSHEITHKDYNSKYMTLKKDDKSANKTKDKPRKQITKTKLPSSQIDNKVKTESKITDKNTSEIPKKASCKRLQSDDDNEEDESGPSSGIRMTDEERQINLCELYRLQRKMLRGIMSTEDDDEEEQTKLDTDERVEGEEYILSE